MQSQIGQVLRRVLKKFTCATLRTKRLGFQKACGNMDLAIFRFNIFGNLIQYSEKVSEDKFSITKNIQSVES